MAEIRKRGFWVGMIESAWRRRSVIWLQGVRRVGKTCLCKSLPHVRYFDCDLRSVRSKLDDPETFLESHRGRRIILDEIHRLDNPTEVLKNAADHYPDVKIIATGSSILGASAKFRDTLTGRKEQLWLTPMISDDLRAFGEMDMNHRLCRGGLPPFFLSGSLLDRSVEEWMDAYWARDIQELFRLERRHSFRKFAQLLIVQSGGIFEANRFSGPCEVSRPTIANYLAVLESTFVAHLVRPFSSRRASEITSAPKVYAFDTGFVWHYAGWRELRPTDAGRLWEHFVLNEIQGCLQVRSLNYWRDKAGHEVDFVMARRGRPPVAIECKWSAQDFDAGAVRAFRGVYPSGENFVVVGGNPPLRPFVKTLGKTEVCFLGIASLISRLLLTRKK